MKKVIISLFLIVFATASFSQQIIQKQTLTKADYQQKSKKQKKIAFIFLGAGAAMIITGVIIPEGELTDRFDPRTFSYYHKNDGIKGALILGGGLSMLGSIPFFIASGKNKRRSNAISAFIQMERAPILQGMAFSTQSFPAAGMRISL